MPEARKRPCAICRRWFPAEPASGTPPTCLREAGMPDVAPTENPSQLAPPEPRLRHRLADRPTRGADPIPARTVAVARAVETSSGRISLIRRDFPAHPPCRRERPVPAWAILNPQATMQREFHHLDRRWEHLRVRPPHRQRRLMASLAESGQQTPIVVVLSPDHRDRYLVIDGHKRIAALQQPHEQKVLFALAHRLVIQPRAIDAQQLALPPHTDLRAAPLHQRPHLLN